MKRVSAKMFFSVVWKGICQTLCWFFGLFGYKRDGKFAKCVWGMFATIAALIMVIAAGCLVYALGHEYYQRNYRWKKEIENDGGQYVSARIGYVNFYSDDGYLIDKVTGKKILKGIEWIAKPTGNDTLVCYSDGKLRGYFGKNSGKVVIKPQYKHAWIFSEGLAAVEENGVIKFIDATGKVVIENATQYNPASDGYAFHGGYLVVSDNDNHTCGLMDKSGKYVLAKEYDNIYSSNNLKYWLVTKGEESAVYDKDMNIVLPFTEGNVYLGQYIDVTMPDHTMRKYDYEGNLINDFYISSTHYLRYDTGETYYSKDSYTDDDGEEHEYLTEESKTEKARLWAYSAGGREGLMTQEGHIITMPLYEEIEAIGPDTYLCTVSDGDKVVVNGKGEVVR